MSSRFATLTLLAICAVFLMTACDRKNTKPPPAPPPAAGLSFDREKISLNLGTAQAEEVTVVLKNTLREASEFELILPDPEEGTFGLFLDVAANTVPDRLEAGVDNSFIFLIGCPVVAESYTAEIRVETTAGTARLPIAATCREVPIETVINEDTKIIGDDIRHLLRNYDPETGRLEFLADSPLLTSLKAGDIIVSGAGTVPDLEAEKAPEGYLRRITGVRLEGEFVVLETVQASLDEALDQGEFDHEFIPANSDAILDIATFLEGVSVSLEPWSPELGTEELSPEALVLRVRFDEVIVSEGRNQARVNGSVAVQPSFRTRGRWTTTWKQACIDVWLTKICGKVVPSVSWYAYAGVDLKQTTNLRITSNVSNAVRNREIKIAEVPFTPYVISVGIPVVVTQKLVFYLDAELNIRAELTYSADATTHVWAGLEASSGRLRPVSGRSGSIAEANHRLSFSGAASAGLYPRVYWEARLYGLIGPLADMRAGPRVTVGINQNGTRHASGDFCYRGRLGSTGIPVLRIGRASFDLFNECVRAWSW